jgi:beta-glucosidase
MRKYITQLFLLSALFVQASAYAESANEQPWMNKALNADERTQLLMKEMTMEEKYLLVFGYFSHDAPWRNHKRPEAGIPQSAGYVPGVPRLGIPAQFQADAGIGVASQPGDNPTPGTSLPSNLAITASWDIDLAFAGGAMIGKEASQHGFNVMLAGGVNLAREPRSGRNFEYGGEDPWLAGTMIGAQIRGIQANHIISTTKHFAFNDQETARGSVNVIIDEQAGRMSDLLAFQIAIEQGKPGSVMCAYNRVNGVHTCESPWLLNEVLKKDWRYKGYVMSDWGGVHSTIPAANSGFDQQSGYPFDRSPYFSDALKDAVLNGHVPLARFNDMVHRILWAMFENGLFDHPPQKSTIDFAAHARVTQHTAEQSMVLLKNSRAILPISNNVKSIAVIGGHADIGVLSGGGASQVYPPGGVALIDKSLRAFPFTVYHASSPMKALQQLTKAELKFDAGADIDSAVALAKQSELVLVFGTQFTGEGLDFNLNLDGKQDELIAALAQTNPNIVVVLETGGAVFMPWLDNVAAVLQAWYPGSNGGEAIARTLTGAVNPSGRLPMTYPQSIDQLPRKKIDGLPLVRDVRPETHYNIEGAAVGYKWFDKNQHQPLFPFGYGLSYTTFVQSLKEADATNNKVSVHVSIKNVGKQSGGAVAQIYVAPIDANVQQQWEAPQRLAGYKKVQLKPGASSTATIEIDPRLLAVYDVASKQWIIAEGNYEIRLSSNARSIISRTKVHLQRLSL